MQNLMHTYTTFTQWRKYEANLKRTSCTCILNAIASCLLHRVNLVLLPIMRAQLMKFVYIIVYCMTFLRQAQNIYLATISIA